MRIVIVSDSLGDTAEAVARAAASQFSCDDATVVRFPNLRSEREFTPVFSAAGPDSVIVYTIVLPGLRESFKRAAQERGIIAVDLMGPLLDALSRVTGQEPKHQPGLVYALDHDYFRRVEAIEFAVRYDDGKDPRGLMKAEIVLMGISRTSKTPVSMYLAHRGYLVANLPLVPEVPLPKEIRRVPPGNIVGLYIDPGQMAKIRRERMRTMGLTGGNYADLERIRDEYNYAMAVFKEIGCHVLDVTGKAVEETANQVLLAVGKERILL